MVDQPMGISTRFRKLLKLAGHVHWSMVLRCLRKPKGECVHSAIAIRDSLVNQLKILQLDFSAQSLWISDA